MDWLNSIRRSNSRQEPPGRPDLDHWLKRLYQEARQRGDRYRYPLAEYIQMAALRQQSLYWQRHLVFYLIERLLPYHLQHRSLPVWGRQTEEYLLDELLLRHLLRAPLAFSEEELGRLFDWYRLLRQQLGENGFLPLMLLLWQLELLAAAGHSPLVLLEKLNSRPFTETYSAHEKILLSGRLEQLLAQSRQPGADRRFLPEEGDGFGEQVQSDLQYLPADKRQVWLALLKHAAQAATPRPTAAYLEQSLSFWNELGEEELIPRLRQWLACLARTELSWLERLSPEGQLQREQGYLFSRNQLIAKGLIWMLIAFPSASAIPELLALARWAYQQTPGYGCRSLLLGKACVLALASCDRPDALGFLLQLREEAETAYQRRLAAQLFAEAATRMGLSLLQLEEQCRRYLVLVQAKQKP